ncbi:DUF605 domain-containing protein [Cephalotus follicularis]|uniref:DUF605 domain-containing protein n=1 Tax=Cephalotus follicularis TaxID=3775 RepID=A0A1Q3D0B7_CEPFO|nr:DUF605 domain-containing protein [Cephalotus follicularis]
MANENEPAKLLLPYLQRADELQKHDPLVAYYCRLYAMERGLKIPTSERTKTTNSLLVSLIKQLEKDKKSLKLTPEDSLHLEGFALNVFAKADKQDRAGRADLSTAKTFYAASIFFEILYQFGPLQPDLEQKQKYAAWKAAYIRKALKEGRKPIPGPPTGDDDLSVPSSTPSGAFEYGRSESSVTSPGRDSDPSPQFRDVVHRQHSMNMPLSPQFPDKVDNHPPDSPPSAPSYPATGYPSHDYNPPSLANRSENPTYSQPYYHQSYPLEPPQNSSHDYPSHDTPQHLPHDYPSHDTPSQHMPHDYQSYETTSQHLLHNYPSHEMPSQRLPNNYPHEIPSYSYPNFQSYPSFTESSLPAVPSNYPSYPQGSDTSYSSQSAPPTTSYPSPAQYTSSNRASGNINGTVSDPASTSVQTFRYDPNYQPPPEKIAEAHKAARFAVGALAFDDVSVAVEHLRKSLELLTNPSSVQ